MKVEWIAGLAVLLSRLALLGRLEEEDNIIVESKGAVCSAIECLFLPEQRFVVIAELSRYGEKCVELERQRVQLASLPCARIGRIDSMRGSIW